MSGEPTTTTRVALVTGGARGIGRAVAELLARRGFAVVVSDLAIDAARRVAHELGESAVGLAADVSKADEVKNLIGTTTERFGRLDVLVAAAGILYPTRFREIPEAEWRRTLDVNLTGVFLTVQAAAEPMVRQRYGRIVTISSTAGKTVSTLGGAHYTASKAGVLGLTRAAAKELAPFGITVNAVCPGLIDTEMVRQNVTPERLEGYRIRFPVQRIGTPGEVASLVAFLVSEEASYITGASCDVNGGDLMV